MISTIKSSSRVGAGLVLLGAFTQPNYVEGTHMYCSRLQHAPIAGPVKSYNGPCRLTRNEGKHRVQTELATSLEKILQKKRTPHSKFDNNGILTAPQNQEARVSAALLDSFLSNLPMATLGAVGSAGCTIPMDAILAMVDMAQKSREVYTAVQIHERRVRYEKHQDCTADAETLLTDQEFSELLKAAPKMGEIEKLQEKYNKLNRPLTKEESSELVQRTAEAARGTEDTRAYKLAKEAYTNTFDSALVAQAQAIIFQTQNSPQDVLNGLVAPFLYYVFKYLSDMAIEDCERENFMMSYHDKASQVHQKNLKQEAEVRRAQEQAMKLKPAKSVGFLQSVASLVCRA